MNCFNCKCNTIIADLSNTEEESKFFCYMCGSEERTFINVLGEKETVYDKAIGTKYLAYKKERGIELPKIIISQIYEHAQDKSIELFVNYVNKEKDKLSMAFYTIQQEESVFLKVDLLLDKEHQETILKPLQKSA